MIRFRVSRVIVSLGLGSLGLGYRAWLITSRSNMDNSLVTVQIPVWPTPTFQQPESKVYVDLYSAFLCILSQMRSDMDHTVLPANYTMPAFTPQPQNITALWLVLILPSHVG